MPKAKTSRLEETTWTALDYMVEDSPRWTQMSHWLKQSARPVIMCSGICWLQVVLDMQTRNDDDAH